MRLPVALTVLGPLGPVALAVLGVPTGHEASSSRDTHVISEGCHVKHTHDKLRPSRGFQKHRVDSKSIAWVGEFPLVYGEREVSTCGAKWNLLTIPHAGHLAKRTIVPRIGHVVKR